MSANELVQVAGVVLLHQDDRREGLGQLILNTTNELELVVAEERGRGAELRSLLRRPVVLVGYLDHESRLIVLDLKAAQTNGD